MQESAASILKELWPEFDPLSCRSMDFELEFKDKEIISAVLEERKCRCILCGRADFNNCDFSFTLLRKKIMSIHAHCPCGYRIVTISFSSLLPKPKTKKKPVQVSLETLLKVAAIAQSGESEASASGRQVRKATNGIDTR